MRIRKRMEWLLYWVTLGATIGLALLYFTHWWWWIPIGAVAGATFQFASYGFRGYFRL